MENECHEPDNIPQYPNLAAGEDIHALRTAFDALPGMQQAVADAELWWQTQENIKDGIFCSYFGEGPAEWAKRCSPDGSLSADRLTHVWGKIERQEPNYVQMAGEMPINYPALIMQQGLLAYLASKGSVPKAEPFRRAGELTGACSDIGRAREKVQEIERIRRLRSLRHMVENTPSADFPINMKAMLAEARDLVVTGHIAEDSGTFSRRQKREERRKQRWLTSAAWEREPERERALRLFENHPLLRGAVDIFDEDDMYMNHYYAFCELFNDIDTRYGELLRMVFLHCGLDMRHGTPGKAYWRRFLTLDWGEAQDRKQQAIRRLLSVPLGQFNIVECEFDPEVDWPADSTDPRILKAAYYNKFPHGREEYLLSLMGE